ncbi:MAG: YigZ family protein [Anaerorhabdus sp.]
MRIKEEFNHELIIDKSRFICYLKKVDNIDDAKEYIDQIKKLHRDSTHCCSAIVCGDNYEIERCSDDGEPSGTAGLPMLTALKKIGIKDCVAVVVRYFGGIKLGGGGLIRAYGRSVSESVSLASKVRLVKLKEYRLVFAYNLIGKLEYELQKICLIVNKNYEELVEYIVHSSDDDFTDKVIDLTNGDISIEYINEVESFEDVIN